MSRPPDAWSLPAGGTVIDHPGAYEMPATIYHADPCTEPSLDSTLARVLLQQSPLHAWQAHPRLSPSWEPETADRFDMGTFAHALMLQGENNVEVINAPGWTRPADRQKRDELRAQGKLVMLAEQYNRILAMTGAAAAKFPLYQGDPGEPALFEEGKPEVSLFWYEEKHKVWCRARLDWLRHDLRWIDDYKTTGGSANPLMWTQMLFREQYDVQAAFYVRAVRTIWPDSAPQLRFVVQEQKPPHEFSVIGLDAAALSVAEDMVETAIGEWAKCLRSGTWDGYSRRMARAGLPPWREARWLEQMGG